MDYDTLFKILQTLLKRKDDLASSDAITQIVYSAGFDPLVISAFLDMPLADFSRLTTLQVFTLHQLAAE